MAFTRITSTNIANNAIGPDKVNSAFEADYAKVANLANYAAIAEISLSVSPKINVVSYANSTYSILDDTAANTEGGYLVITGTGFQSGAQVVIGTTPATSTTYVSSTELRAQVPAANASTYQLAVVNPDGGTGIKINGITYSGTPTWVTGSALSNWIVDISANVAFDATGATSYANTTALPAGTTLLSNGYFYGTVTGIGSDTTYNFTIAAIDNENQDSERTFSLTVTVSNAPTSVEYLVVAGGAGGGRNSGGGGAGGGYRTGTLSVTTGQSYTVTVGSGGNGATSDSVKGSSGTDSVFSSITSSGGGGGGTSPSPVANGDSGGSGGGGAGYSTATRIAGSGGSGNTPSVSPSQGNNGGAGATNAPSPSGQSTLCGGGGGGAGAVGGSAYVELSNPSTEAAGNGGSGSSSSISGTSVTYAGGGGGGGYYNNGGTGGAGGGGAGGNPGSAGSNGTVNTGGGGGGGNSRPSPYSGGNGGSGVVIIRYADTYDSAVSTTGSPTFTTSGGYKIYKFTGSGSITW